MARSRFSGEFFVKIGLVILFLFYAWSFGTGVDASGQVADGAYQVVHVSRGDTLWSIASKHAGKNEDVRNLIVAIKKLNNLGNDVVIHPGQALKVPLR